MGPAVRSAVVLLVQPDFAHRPLERFGPVREVEKGLVLEVAFDAAQRSGRHKSGVALRFPRIARIRRDKPAEEADRLEAVLALITDGASTPDQT